MINNKNNFYLDYLVDKTIENIHLNTELTPLRFSVYSRSFMFFLTKSNKRVSFFNIFKQQRKKCVQTDRYRAISHLTRTTRHKFKESADENSLFGVQPASW